MRTDELDYDLPTELIATEPMQPRDHARLLVLRRDRDTLEHRRVADLPDLEGGPSPGDLLVLNETRVIPAAFTGIRTRTGGQVSGLFLRETEPGRWQCMLESGGRLQPGETVTLREDAVLELVDREGEGVWAAKLVSPLPTFGLLDAIGRPPLPPYIRKQRRERQEPEHRPDDAQRYNTVYARQPGSVAAPTAGLHFTPELFTRLKDNGVTLATVTLDVGPGTFAPVRTQQIDDHPIHAERLTVPAATIAQLQRTRQAGGRIMPVGTTTVRALESLPADALDSASPQEFSTWTNLFIRPTRRTGGEDQPYPFRFTDGLMTNFHLPRSTLLALVAALPGVGLGRLLATYQQAIAARYRFYSFGDAMLVL